jgi:putative glutamine amidotransferase
LLAGGGDINPKWYGQEPTSDQLYGIDDLQDENDFSIAKYALDNGIPVLAICRGCQIVNVLKGGSLVQHMDKDHRHHVHTIHLERGATELGLSKPELEASCFHHQAIDKLGDDLEVLATASEGHVEAFKIKAKTWAFGVQWHPEDNADTNEQQHELFVKFVSEAAKN